MREENNRRLQKSHSKPQKTRVPVVNEHPSTEESPKSKQNNKSNKNFWEREIGSLSSNYTRVKVFFKKVFFYFSNLFTLKKYKEIQDIFSYEKMVKESQLTNNQTCSIKNRKEIRH